MKRLFALSVVLAVSVAAAPVSRAQSGGMQGMDMKGMDMKDMPMHDMSTHDMKATKSGKQTPVHKASGTVQKVDAANGSVTLAHGPVKSLNWPAMTMPFAVKDKALLDKIKPGAKVEFGFVQSGKDYVVTEIKGQ